MRCLPLALLAALAACTPDAPRIQQVDAPADSRDPVGPYALVASIDGKTDVIVVSWLADDVPGPTLGMSRRGDGRYEARLPGQPPGTTVRLRVLVDGPGGEDEWPGDGEYHEFRVLAADGACLVDGDCLGDELCDRLRGVCKPRPEVCVDDGDCPLDTVCADGACRFAPTTCEDDAQCGPGRVCEAGRCVSRPECREDADCPDGACLTPPGRCIAAGGCRVDADCPADLPVCRAGACAPGPCGGGCPAPLVCLDDACVDPGACGGPCPPGLRCLPDQGCVGCTADGQCGAGAHCATDDDFTCRRGERLGACQPCGPGGACGFDQRCDAELGFLCLAACERDRDCPAGNTCQGGVCRGDPLCGGRACRRDDECDGACLGGACTPRQICERDADCAEDWRCDGGRCLPTAPTCFGTDACPQGQICLGGRCAPGGPAGACAPCDGPDSCASPALCIDLDGTGSRCVALCGRDGCPAGLACLDAGPFGVCLSGDGVCPRGRCGLDAFEPNDDLRDPAVLPAQVEGAICAADTDVFAVPGEGASIAWRVTPVDGPLGVLRLVGGEPIAEDNLQPDEFLEFTALGRLQLMVITTPADGEVRYLIERRMAPPMRCDDDFLEENDDARQATILGNGADVNPIACAGDADWFRLRMSPGDAGVARLTVPGPVDGGLAWSLEDATGEALGAGVIREGGADIQLSYREQLYLRVECPACGRTPYRLTTRFQAGGGCPADALEPNDELGGAREIGVPFDRAELAACVADDDWYAFTAPGGQRVRLDLDFTHAQGDIDVELFDEQGALVDASTSATDNEQIDLPVRRRNTRYFARVFLFPGRGAFNPYRLRLRPR